ncbi:hypothetical protein [Kribbella sp. NPDC051770]|uniref:hypothetical protein n=1 Tax=Kribbella sp. NPDC051770 TaxID=3155413 RepID=UPI00343471A1
MRHQYAVLLAAAALLTGCSASVVAEPDGQPVDVPSTPMGFPSIVGGTVPVPTITPDTAKPTDAAKPPATPDQATAPPPAEAGPVSSKNLPPVDKLGNGWKTYVDPAGAEAGWISNNNWTRERNAHQAAFEALPVGCKGKLPASSLPVPQYALQATYRTGPDLPATALLLRFSDEQQAQQYYTGYEARVKACGTSSDADLSIKPLWSEQDAAAQLRNYAGASAYAEVAVRQGRTVALVASAAADPAPQPNADWAHSVVPQLRTVIDSA